MRLANNSSINAINPSPRDRTQNELTEQSQERIFGPYIEEDLSYDSNK